jgi:hypothetical protein
VILDSNRRPLVLKDGALPLQLSLMQATSMAIETKARSEAGSVMQENARRLRTCRSLERVCLRGAKH